MSPLRLLLPLAVALLFAPCVQADGFLTGLAAYDAGRYGEAAAQWREGAAAGNPMAHLGLAGLYRQGLGVPFDMAAAARHYEAAARAGNADGQRNLGELYARGHGVARDPAEAWAWLGLAAAQGNAWAERRQVDIEAGMPEEQRARARRRIEELQLQIGD